MHASRRTFLATALGAAAVLPAASFAAVSGPRGRAYRLKLGLASYSVRKFTLDQTLEMCKDMDVAYINIKDFHIPMTDSAEAIAAARKKIEAAGLTIMGGGTITLKNDAAQIKSAFTYAKAAGFPLIVAAPEPAAFDLIEKAIQEFDIKVGIHNHGPEDKSFPAPQDAYRLLKGRDPRFGLCMDVGHSDASRSRPGQDRGRVQGPPARHARQGPEGEDRQGKPDRGGQGSPGLPRPLPRPQKIAYAGHVGLEYEINETSPQVGMKESFAYMRGVLDAIEG